MNCPFICPKCNQKLSRVEVGTSFDFCEFVCSCSQNNVENLDLTIMIVIKKEKLITLNLFLDLDFEGNYLSYHYDEGSSAKISLEGNNEISQIICDDVSVYTPEEAWKLLKRYHKLISFI